MVSKAKKSGTASPGKAKVIKESDEEMQSLATSLGQGLALAAQARELTDPPREKPSKQAVKKAQGITQSVADAAPPPLPTEMGE